MNFHWRLFLTLWILFFVFTTTFWIFKNNLPPSWDEANYLGASEILHQTLKDKGVLAFLAKTTTILGTKAPLITIIPIPLYLLFGSSPHVAMILNLFFALVFFYFFYRLVLLIFDEKTAMSSCIIVSTMILFYGLVRYFFVEFGLMVLVVIWIYLAVKTKHLTDRKHLFFLGLVSGLGVLMKFHFILFVTGPTLIIIIESWKSQKSKIINLKNLLIFFIPAMIIALPWYSRNILTVLWKAKRSVNPQLLGSLYYGSPFSYKNIYLSALDFINYALSGYWFLVLAILITFYVYKKRRLHINYLLSSWFFIPFIVFYFGPNKDYRLMLPLMPPIAVFLAYLIKQIFERRYAATFFVIIFFPTLVYLNTSIFNSYLIKSKISLGPIIFADKKIGSYAQVPSVAKWPVEETLIFIESYNTTGERRVVISASESEAFNINSLRYYALLAKVPLEVNTISYFPNNTNYRVIEENINKGDYLIMKVGGNPGPKDLNRFNDLIIQNIDYKKWREIRNEITLPDEGQLKIWQKIS